MAEPALHNFSLFIEGKNMESVIDNGQYYDEYIQTLLGPNGKTQASSFELKEFDNNHIVYDVTVDTLIYPKLIDFATQFKSALAQNTKERKITAEVYKSGGRDVVYINLEYSYKYEDLEKDLDESKIRVSKYQDLIKQYNKALKDKDFNLANSIKPQIPDYYFTSEEEQNVQVTPSTSAAETELQKKAIEVEQEEEEQESRPSEIEAPKEVSQPVVVQPAVKETPVILPPSEKSTIETTKSEATTDRSLIESISNMVFDKRILEYEAVASTEKEETNNIASLTERQMLDRKELIDRSKTGTEASQAQQTVSAQTEQPTLFSSISSLITNNIAQQLESSIEEATSSISKEGGSSLVTSLSTMLSKASETAGTKESISSVMQQGADSIKSLVESAQKDVTSLVNNASEIVDSTSSRVEEGLLKTERSSTATDALRDIQSKITQVESMPQIVGQLESLATTISDSVKNAVTSINTSDKTMASSASSSKIQVKEGASENAQNVAASEALTDNSAGLLNQNMFNNGQAPYPSVVSLSQSTIDNLASAIIKNMSIMPFLNSGR